MLLVIPAIPNKKIAHQIKNPAIEGFSIAGLNKTMQELSYKNQTIFGSNRTLKLFRTHFFI